MSGFTSDQITAAFNAALPADATTQQLDALVGGTVGFIQSMAAAGVTDFTQLAGPLSRLLVQAQIDALALQQTKNQATANASIAAVNTENSALQAQIDALKAHLVTLV